MEKKFLRKGPKNHPFPSFKQTRCSLRRSSQETHQLEIALPVYKASELQLKSPLNGESQPGKPKDAPKGDFFRPPYADQLPSPQARAPHVPVPPPRAPMAPVSEWEVNKVQLWKKLIERGHKTVKKVRPKAARAASITVARGSVIFGGFDGILPKPNYYSDYFNSSIVPSSSHSASSSSNNSFAFDGTSKLQNFAKGCIKWAI